MSALMGTYGQLAPETLSQSGVDDMTTSEKNKNNDKKIIKNSRLVTKPHNGAVMHQFVACLSR